LFGPKSFVFLLISKALKIKIHKTVILSLVLYGCETWSLTLKEEHRLRVFENKVFRKIFGPRSEKEYIKEYEVGGTCGTHVREDRFLQGFGWEARRQETTEKT
jgi:hypothetical protein